MSRSGYSDDCEGTELNLWRGAVESAIRGKRGQAMLRETLAALDAMPEKRLGAESLVTAEGDFCTLGALGSARGMDLSQIDPDDRDAVARAFGVSGALAAEIMFLNDEGFDDHEWVRVEICGPMRPHYYHGDNRSHIRTVRIPIPNAPAKRWQYMRDWVAKNIKPASDPSKGNV